MENAAGLTKAWLQKTIIHIDFKYFLLQRKNTLAKITNQSQQFKAALSNFAINDLNWSYDG